jgi:glutamine synthetase
VLIAAGLAGVRGGGSLPEPIQEDPGGWDAQERERRGVVALPSAPEEQLAAVEASEAVREALGRPMLGAWSVVRRADAESFRDRSPEEIVAAHRWRY